MRALVVTSLYPSRAHPARGSFVRDQVAALQRLPHVELELFAFDPGGARPYVEAARELRRRYRGARFDVVHAHFGLTAWPALGVRGAPHALTVHGTDLVHPRSRAITLSALPLIDLVAPVSPALRAKLPWWVAPEKVSVLPCGVDTGRFRPIPREDARRELGLDPAGHYLLFPSHPARPEKRYDRARAAAGVATLLTLGDTDPEQMPLWINASNAVLVPSERESFGLAVLEALACDVPVLATPVGVAPDVLEGVSGAYCGPFEVAGWRAALEPLLAAEDPRVEGRVRAERYSAARMAQRVLEAWWGLA